ncbi:hypothetical protein C3L33_13131, partial [Rhododendron williamsianum]
MSRTLLSRIKPRPKNPTSSSPYARFKPQTKRLVNEICQILATQNNTQWQDTLETLLSEQETAPSDITHFVLDRIRDPELGLKFFDWVSNRPYGCSVDGFAYSSLLKLLARSRVFLEIERLMGVMRVEDKVPSREALDDVIRAYSDSGLAGKAVEFYRVFVSMYGYVPSVIGFNSLLDVIVKRGRIDVARQVYDEMIGREDGCVDNYSTCIMVRGLCKEGKVEEGRKLIDDRWGKGCVPNIVFYNTLIDGYCKKGDVERAYALFKELKSKGFLPAVETYGAMINGHGCAVKAEETVRKMIDSGCEPDIVTFNTLINGSCRNGKVQEAKQLLEQATRKGLMPTKLTYTPIVQGYSKFGMMNDAVSCINRMMQRCISPDEYTYSIMVDGYVKQHDLNGALRMFTQMVKRKFYFVSIFRYGGDILLLHMGKDPIRAGEIVVFNVEVHKRKDNGEVDVLTKEFIGQDMVMCSFKDYTSCPLYNLDSVEEINGIILYFTWTRPDYVVVIRLRIWFVFNAATPSYYLKRYSIALYGGYP